jgi:transcriptional regulator with XRE-family HTH domain
MRLPGGMEGCLDKPLAAVVDDRTAGVLNTIGRNIRQLRVERGLTLQALADRTKLSPSMLSLLERGKTGPSIGTLVVIAASLGAQMNDLLDRTGAASDNMVSRVKDQPVVSTESGVTRRILKQDRIRNIEIAINEYDPGTSSAPTAHGHEGYEFGVVLEGALQVTVNGQSEVLRPGDLISYPSPQPHRFANSGSKRARTLWINLRRS